MLKILLVSDNHGDVSVLNKVLLQSDFCNIKVHCGDSVMDEEYIKKHFDYAVRGNNDFNSLPIEQTFSYEKFRFLVIHGDEITWKRENYFKEFAEYAKKKNCNVVLHGHMHTIVDTTYDGVRIICPGALMYPRTSVGKTYMILNVSSSEINIFLKML
ncbi:YfcE family phosphodiesterase [symbiont of Argiope bruennichi]|uniref:metallophosphoesterase family protein n=1 Tax=symbiont of Argiope bruennichi TaxID=2810479 RepID=UPI003DA4CEAC